MKADIHINGDNIFEHGYDMYSGRVQTWLGYVEYCFNMHEDGVQLRGRPHGGSRAPLAPHLYIQRM